MQKLIKPDLTRRENYPIYGDTITFSQGQGRDIHQYVGVISEHNVGGPQAWDVMVDGNTPMHVHGSEIEHIERTGEIPMCPTVEYDPNIDPDLKDMFFQDLVVRMKDNKNLLDGNEIFRKSSQ